MDDIKEVTESSIEIHVVCFGVYELCGMSTTPLFSGEELYQYSLHTLSTLLDVSVLQKVQWNVKEALGKWHCWYVAIKKLTYYAE